MSSVPATTWLIAYEALTCSLLNGAASSANTNFLVVASHFTVNNPFVSVCTSSPATLFGKVTCVLIVRTLPSVRSAVAVTSPPAVTLTLTALCANV